MRLPVLFSIGFQRSGVLLAASAVALSACSLVIADGAAALAPATLTGPVAIQACTVPPFKSSIEIRHVCLRRGAANYAAADSATKPSMTKPSATKPAPSDYSVADDYCHARCDQQYEYCRYRGESHEYCMRALIRCRADC